MIQWHLQIAQIVDDGSNLL